MKKIRRTTRKFGHNVITTLSSYVLKQLKMKFGNQVEIRKEQQESDDFLATVNEVMADYNKALENLVSR